MSITPLTLNGCQTASTTLTTANQIVATQTGTTTANSNTKIGTSTGYGEIYAQGSTAVWPALGAIGAPSGNGWLYDVVTLEGQTIPVGNWQWVEKVRVTNVSIVADIIVRAYKRSSGGVYTLIGTVTLGSTTVPSTSTAFMSALTSLSATSFATGDKLYIDLWLNIRTNSSGVTSTTFNVIECSNASSGVSGIAQMLTPGYQPTSATPIVVTAPATLSFTAMTGAGNPASQNDTLSETAGAGTAWTSAISYGSGSGWLALSPASGTLAANGTQIVAYTCTTGSLTAGTYTATVTYTATTGGATATVAVTFVVTSAPALSTSPTALSFTAIYRGMNPATQTDVLTNTGGTSTAWTSAIAYGSGSGWLSTSPTSGTLASGAHATLTLTCATGTLAIGTYTATVTFTAMTGGATAIIGVTFVVTQLHMITIASSPVTFAEDTFRLSKKLDERWRCQFTVLDYAGTQQFSYRQQVVVTDAALGILFTGFVADVKQDKTQTYPDATIEHKIDCIDNRGLADKRTSNYLYANQQAGVIAAHQIQTYLAAEGVTMAAALDWNESLEEWQEGTMSGTVATINAMDSNPLDGDLELAPAGTALSYLDTFAAGTLSGVAVVNGTLQLASTRGLVLTGTAVQGVSNPYAYVKIWTGSYVIASGDALQYDVWIASTSPKQQSAVDGVCSDGTTLRDFTSGGVALQDQNGLTSHPTTDLSGFATDEWYTRTIDLTPLAGKTLSYVTVAFEGDSQGNYTSYFRHVKLKNGGSTPLTVFESSLQTNQLAFVNAYQSVVLQQTTVYETQGTRTAPVVSIGSVGIANSSQVAYTQSAIASSLTPTVTSTNSKLPTVSIQTSIDNGATWQPCTANAAIPNLLPGMSLGSRNLQIRQVFAQQGTDPTLTPVLTGLLVTINPSYTATKTDVIQTEQTQANWNAGTLTKLTANADNSLTLNEQSRNYVSIPLTDQTLYGNGAPQQSLSVGYLQLSTNGTQNDARSRQDWAGTWLDFTAEVDINVGNPTIAQTLTGIEYGTTNWNNNLNGFGYSAYFIATNTSGVGNLVLGYGTNGGGTIFTQLASFPITLSSGSTHRLKVVYVSSTHSHTVYLDGVQYISLTDSTYTNTAYIALRFYNNSGARHSGQLGNFGVCKSLTGTYTTVSQSLSAATTVGNSLIAWQQTPDPTLSTGLVVQTSIDGGSTYQVCTNGGLIPNLTPGLALAGKSLLVQVLFSSPSANLTPILTGLTAWVVGQFSAIGTWISPALALSPVTNAATALVNWNDNLPNTNTAVAVATSVDGGSTYQTVVNAGNPIANLVLQPPPAEDTFSADTHANYTQTNLTNGGSATWVWDTANNRLVATQTTGIDGVLEYNGATGADMAVQADLSYSDSGGPLARMVDASDAYFLSIADAQAVANPNSARLYKVTASSGLTPLTVYGSNVADATIATAGQLSAAPGGTDVIATTKIGTATGYGEIVALGTASAWQALAGPITSIAPTGKGWLFDSSVLASQQFPGGNWTPTLYLRSPAGAVTADMWIRAYAYDTSALTYTLIGDMELAAQTITVTATTYAFGATNVGAFTFNATQKLYIDCWFNITVASASSSATIAFHESSSGVSGVVGEMQLVTPGYQSPISTTALTAYLASAHSSTVVTSDQLYTVAGTPATGVHDVIVGKAINFGEITSRLASSGGGSGTDSPYGAVYYFGGHPGGTVNLLSAKFIDLLVGGNTSGLGVEVGWIPGGPIWARPQIRWELIEYPQGVYNWSVVDDMVGRCNAANILINFNIMIPPTFRLDTGLDGSAQTPGSSTAYFASGAMTVAYATALSQRYNGSVNNGATGKPMIIQCFQWNEDYDTPGTNAQRDIQSQWFVENWQIVGPIFRANAPNAILVGPASRYTTSGFVHRTTWTTNIFTYKPPRSGGVEWVGAIVDAHGNRILDALDFHYYRNGAVDLNGVAQPDPTVTTYLKGGVNIDVATPAQIIIAFKQIAANHGYTNFDVWCTETGWNVYPDPAKPNPYVTQAQQSQYIRSSYDQHRLNGGTHMQVWVINPTAVVDLTSGTGSTAEPKSIVFNEERVGGTTFVEYPAYTDMRDIYIPANPNGSWGGGVGGSGTWAALSSQGVPTGNGWMLDSTVLENQQFAIGGTWSATITLAAFVGGAPSGTIVGDLYVRASKYSGGIYTTIANTVLLAQSILSTAGPFTTTATCSPASFAVGDKLYVDIWVAVTTNANNNTLQAIRLQKLSTDTAGFTGSTGAQIVTSGYSPVVGAGGIQTTLLASAAIAFVRGMYHRFILDVRGSTLTAFMDGVQFLQVTDTGVTGIGGGGLLAGIATGHVLRCTGLRVAPYGQNVSALSVLTKITLTSTDPTQTPQMLDLQTFVANASIGAGVVIPSAAYTRTFVDKNLDDLGKQSNFGWYIDQFKQAYFQDRQTSPAPWILYSNTLGMPSDLEADSNLLVEDAGDLYRNRQVLTNVIGAATFSDPFVGNGTVASFTLRYPLAIGSIPVIVLNGQSQSVGIAGGPTAQWYYTPGSSGIAQDVTGTVLTALDTLLISYIGTFPTEVVLNNVAAQTALALVEGGSGIVESVEDVTALNMTYAAAQVYAQALLDRYCVTGRTLTCTIFRDGLAVGHILAVIVPEEHLNNVRLLIRQIDITMQTQPGQIVLYEYSVQATELANTGSWQKLISSGLF